MFQFYVDKKDCSHHQIFAGVDFFTTCGERMTLSLVEMQPHAVIPEHSHPHEQLGMLIAGTLHFTIGGESRVVTPGQMWRISWRSAPRGRCGRRTGACARRVLSDPRGLSMTRSSPLWITGGMLCLADV